MRYQKIYVQIWNDEKFIQLSEPSKVFFLYLLTSPHSNLIGAFVLKKGYVAEDLIWSIQKVDKALKEVEKSGLLTFDKKVSVAVINNYLKYNPLENPNQFTGASNIFYTLPKTEILINIFNKLETLSKRFNRPFKTASKPEAVTETVTEAVTETDKPFLSDSTEYRLAELLQKEILSNKPDHKAKDANLQTWSKHIDLMIRRDNRNPELVGKVIKWCQRDSFWKSNIESTASLRDKFDRLESKMNGGKGFSSQNLKEKNYGEGVNADGSF